MKHSESIKAIADAMSKAQAQMKGAVKDSSNPFFKSKYADLASVVAAIREPFGLNGLSFSQFPCTNDKEEVGVETIVMHSSGEWIMGDPFFVPVSKNDAQGFGSAITYCRRYSLQSIAAVPAEDDDGNAASRTSAQAPNPRTVVNPIVQDGDLWTGEYITSFVEKDVKGTKVWYFNLASRRQVGTKDKALAESAMALVSSPGSTSVAVDITVKAGKKPGTIEMTTIEQADDVPMP